MQGDAMRLPLPCCCFIPAWLILHSVACQSLFLHEHGLNALAMCWPVAHSAALESAGT